MAPSEPPSDPYDAARAAAMATGYQTFYRSMPLSVRALSVPYASHIINPKTGHPNQTFYLGGVAEAVVEDDGELWGLDLRFTASDLAPGGTLWQRLRLGTRTLGLLLGLLSDTPTLAGVIVEIVRKPELRPKLATPAEQRKYVTDKVTKARRLDLRQRDSDESPEEFCERLASDFAERPDWYVARAKFQYTAREFEEAQYDLSASARFIRDHENADKWPRNPEACEQRGSLCPYFDVCRGVSSLGDSRFEKKEPLTDAHDEPVSY